MSEYIFNAEEARDNLVRGVAELAQKQGFTRVVIGISGGKDSTVCAAVCARALGKENVYGIMMPDGEQKDISDSIEVCNALGIKYKTVNIGKMHEALHEALNFDSAAEGEFMVCFDRESNINVGPVTITITGTGDYTGSLEKSFTIAAANIACSSAAPTPAALASA